jgi:predicted O-methyltransferase YrrM
MGESGASSASAATAGAICQHIEQLYATRKLVGEDGVVCELDTLSVTAERGAFIAGVCREYRPSATLEIGMAWGMSTLFMLEAMAETGAAHPGCHAVIDPFQFSYFHNAALKAVRDAGAFELIEFYAEPSQIVLPRMVSAGRRFDLAFIDGDHRFEAAFLDFYFIDQLLKPGGIVIFDDLGMDGVFLTCAFAEKNHHYIPRQEYISADLARRWKRRKDPRTGRYVRPAIRVYQKPMNASVRDEFFVAPFFRDIVQFEGIPGVVSPRLVRNRLNHIGRIALLEGDRLTARRAFSRSLQVGRLQFGTWMRWLRTFLPAGLAARLTGRKSRAQQAAARSEV